MVGGRSCPALYVPFMEEENHTGGGGRYGTAVDEGEIVVITSSHALAVVTPGGEDDPVPSAVAGEDGRVCPSSSPFSPTRGDAFHDVLVSLSPPCSLSGLERGGGKEDTSGGGTLGRGNRRVVLCAKYVKK